MFGLLDVWDVRCWGCRVFQMWDVQDLGCSIPEFLPKHSCTQQIASTIFTLQETNLNAYVAGACTVVHSHFVMTQFEVSW